MCRSSFGSAADKFRSRRQKIGVAIPAVKSGLFVGLNCV